MSEDLRKCSGECEVIKLHDDNITVRKVLSVA